MYTHVVHNVNRPAVELVERFRNIWASTLCDAMGRHGVTGPEIRPIFEDIHLVGTALTVLCFPGDNITTHKALQLAQPGDVLVVDDGGAHNTSVFGHNMSLRARKKGVVGLVTNGAVRDLRLLREDRFPIFCSGVCPRSPQKNTPGAVNIPVQVGGVVVQPGDIVVGDDDGVAVVPLAIVDEIIGKAEERMEMERRQADAIKAGDVPLEILYGPTWVDDILDGKVTDVTAFDDRSR